MRFLAVSIAFLASAASTVLAEEILKIDVTNSVDCKRKTREGDNIQVHYRGTLQSDGSEFDASHNRGVPISFVLGKGNVIKGWDEGLLDMCIGDKRILTIPPNLGYGDRTVGPIPARSTLIFETELMGIQGVEPPPAGVKETVSSIISEAAEAAKTGIADTDANGVDHKEL